MINPAVIRFNPCPSVLKSFLRNISYEFNILLIFFIAVNFTCVNLSFRSSAELFSALNTRRKQRAQQPRHKPKTVRFCRQK